MVRPADGAFEFGQILLGLVTGEAILPDPIVVDLGLTGLANDLGLGGSSKSAILVEFTVVKQGSEAKEEGVEGQQVQVPFISLGHADAVVHRSKGRVVRAKTDTLS